MLSLGVDPGFASTGIGAVEYVDGVYRSRGVMLSVTEPAKGKGHTKLRTTWDDERRVRLHWTAVTEAIAKLKPDVIGVEAYTIYEPKGAEDLRNTARAAARALQSPGLFGGDLAASLNAAVEASEHRGIGLGQAAKTVLVYGVVLGAAYTVNCPVFIFHPFDIKQRIAKKRGASKDEVGAAIYQLVQGSQAHVEAKVRARTKHEHVTDALGHAVLALQEYRQLRLDMRPEAE